MTAGAGQGDGQGEHDAGHLAEQVIARFGVLPSFFRAPPGAEGMVAGLWSFTRSAYLDNPLPSLFKERLFVHLSRFCEVRYCVIRHACFLAGRGRPAGDGQARPHTPEQIAALLRRPVPQAQALEEVLSRLESVPEPVGIPEPGTRLESDLFDALTVIFLETGQSARARARAAVAAAAGDSAAELLAGLVAFIRTAHYWTEIHPDLPLEPDAVEFLDEHGGLARLLTDPADAVAASAQAAFKRVAADLVRARESLTASEERYQAVFESMDAGFSLIKAIPGGDGYTSYRVVESNSAQSKLTGLPPAAGQPARDLLPAAGGELIARLAEVDSTGNPARFEVQLETADRWLDINVFRATAAASPMLAVVCRDVTDRVRAAADREAQQHAQREFVANAAHELRTPLTAVIAAIETLDRGAVNHPAARDRFFAHVRREAARLARLCDSLLLLADAQSGAALPVTAVSAHAVLDDIAADLHPAPGVTVTVDAPGDLIVTTNRGLLERIIANLAQNAAKYTASGQITLRATATMTATTIEVRDTGQGLGLPAARAVERFSRGGARTADGFGLGLSIAHQAAVAIGASLHLTDNPGGGTLASLILPSAPAAARVLIVEDEQAIGESIAYTLSNAGYQVTEAATGAEGITSAGRDSFDLIIIDLLLPDTPGTDVIRHIRGTADGGRGAILAITAHADAGTRDLVLSAGADRFMTKPFSMSELLDSARSLTSGQVAS